MNLVGILEEGKSINFQVRKTVEKKIQVKWKCLRKNYFWQIDFSFWCNSKTNKSLLKIHMYLLI